MTAGGSLFAERQPESVGRVMEGAIGHVSPLLSSVPAGFAVI